MLTQLTVVFLAALAGSPLHAGNSYTRYVQELAPEVKTALTQALDARPQPGCEDPAISFLLCSDGLTETVTDSLISTYLGRPLVDVACPALVHEAVERGSRDNVTAVIVRVTSRNGGRAF